MNNLKKPLALVGLRLILIKQYFLCIPLGITAYLLVQIQNIFKPNNFMLWCIGIILLILFCMLYELVIATKEWRDEMPKFSPQYWWWILLIFMCVSMSFLSAYEAINKSSLIQYFIMVYPSLSIFVGAIFIISLIVDKIKEKLNEQPGR